jgi:hypothetical protein
VTDIAVRADRDRWGTLRSGQLWRYRLRLQPWSVLLCTLAIGAAWSWSSGLDSSIDLTVLAIMTTVGLAEALQDDAAPTVVATPTSRLLRRLPPMAIAVAVSGVGWLALTLTMSGPANDGDGVGPAASLLEWCAIGASQVALGATVADRGRFRGSVGAPLILALSWGVLAALPRLRAFLWPVDEHAVRWWLVLASSVEVAVVMSLDPAWRRPAFGRLRGNIW